MGSPVMASFIRAAMAATSPTVSTWLGEKPEPVPVIRPTS